MPILIGLPVLVAIAVFAVVFLGGNNPPHQGSQDQGSKTSSVGSSNRQQTSASSESTGASAKPNEGTIAEASAGVSLDHPSLGRADAPVVLIDYSDYQ